MKLPCVKCGQEVNMKQSKGQPPIGKCKCGKVIKAVPMGVSEQIAEKKK